MIVLGCDHWDTEPVIGGDGWVDEGWLNKVNDLAIVVARTWADKMGGMEGKMSW